MFFNQFQGMEIFFFTHIFRQITPLVNNFFSKNVAFTKKKLEVDDVAHALRKFTFALTHF